MSNSVFMFASQGAQYKGMGRDVYQKYGLAREVFDFASTIYGEDLAQLACRASQPKLTQTHCAQMLITVLNVIFYHLTISKGVKPGALLGLSVGEASALYAAGVLSLEDLLRFINVRGKAMHSDAMEYKGKMFAVADVGDERLQDILNRHRGNGVLTISNYNSPNQTVIAGDADSVLSAVDEIVKTGGKAKDLKQEGAWHCLHMNQSRQKCAEFLNSIELNKPKIPVLLNSTGEFESDAESIRDLMAKQLICSVRWKHSLMLLKNKGFSTFYEIGPGKILRGLVLDTFRQQKGFDYSIININSPFAVDKLNDETK